MAIKPVNSDTTTTAIWVGDPAIDKDARIDMSELPDNFPERYLATCQALQVKPDEGPTALCTDAYYVLGPRDPACWARVLKMHEGQEPTRYVIGTMSPTEMTRLEHEYQGSPRFIQCFLSSVRDVINGPTESVKQSDGTYRDEVPHVTRLGEERICPAFVDKNFRRGLRKVLIEVGMMAWNWNTLDEDDAKN